MLSQDELMILLIFFAFEITSECVSGKYLLLLPVHLKCLVCS